MEKADELLKNLSEVMRRPSRCRRQDLKAFLRSLVDRINDRAEDNAQTLRAHLEGDGSMRIYIGHDPSDWDDLPFFELSQADGGFNISLLFSGGSQRNMAPSVTGDVKFVWSPLERRLYSGEMPLPRTSEERAKRDLMEAVLFRLGELIVKRLES